MFYILTLNNRVWYREDMVFSSRNRAEIFAMNWCSSRKWKVVERNAKEAQEAKELY